LLGKHNQPTKVNELNVNDMILTSPNDIAEGFNTFFSNIGPNLAEKIGSTECHFKDYLDKTNSEFTAFKSVSVNHVCLLLRELSGSKATGLDKISSKIINQWKIARVIPLFKNGKRNLRGNYRPISVLRMSYGAHLTYSIL
jgi:hypothetical protein